MSTQCKGKLPKGPKKGERCTTMVKKGDYCRHHLDQESSESLDDGERLAKEIEEFEAYKQNHIYDHKVKMKILKEKYKKYSSKLAKLNGETCEDEGNDSKEQAEETEPIVDAPKKRRGRPKKVETEESVTA